MTKPKLAYFVHGRGRGHASRALSIVPALHAANFEVGLFASRDALPVVRDLGQVQERPLLRGGPVGWSELLIRGVWEARRLRRGGFDLVVADGDQAALLAARLAGLPALAIGHDLVFTCCELPAGLAPRRLLHQRANALIPTHLSTRRVAVHFLPCRATDAHTIAARPVLEPDPDAICEARSHRLVTYFRDGNGDAALKLARTICGDIVHADGKTGALYDRATFRQLLRSSTAAIGSAGSNLLAECVLLGTPLLALYREDDSEQALNAQWLAAAGAGLACSFENLTHERVVEFWDRALAGQFARVPLTDALPSVLEAVVTSVTQMLSTGR